MWLYLIAGFLVVIGVVGAFVGGGIFTLVLIPAGVLVFLAAFASTLLAQRKQAAEDRGQRSGSSADDRLPHSPPRDTGRVPSTPEGLADARRVQQ